MLKHLFLLCIFSGSLDGFSQDKTCGHNLVNCKCMKLQSVIPDTVWLDKKWYILRQGDSLSGVFSLPDTLHAELLVTYTTRRWGVAHARDGYVVRKRAEVIEYLDNNHKPFPMCVTVWGWVKWEERKRRGR